MNEMSTDYFNSSNSICNNTFDACKRQRISSGDLKNTDYDNESLIDYTTETSAKASSSSIHESITNMSNSHSTPEDNYIENALSSPFAKHNRLDCDRDFEVSTDQYSKNPNGILNSILVSSKNHTSIDDTINYVLSRIQEENDFGCFKSSLLLKPSSDLSVSSSSKCDKSKFSNLKTMPNCIDELDHLKRSFSSISYHNSDSQSMQIDSSVLNHNYSTSNFNKNPQQIYNYGNYYSIPNNFNNQMNCNRQPFNKDFDKGNNVYNQYQSMTYRPYMSNSYNNQQYYRQDSQIIPMQPNYQTLQKPIKRESYNHVMQENDLIKKAGFGINFKAPQTNAYGPFDQTVSKRRPANDQNKLSPAKKRKLINQTLLNNNYEDLVNKLKATNNHTLLMNPSFADGKSLLPPLEFIESKTKSIQYKKYKSSPYFIIKPKRFKDHNKCDEFIANFVSDSISGKVLLSDKCILSDGENVPDIVCPSPDYSQSYNILCHLEIDDHLYDAQSPQLSESQTTSSTSCDYPMPKFQVKINDYPSRPVSQLSGSFLKRTKINGKSFSNVHIEETVSVASLAASRSQNCLLPLPCICNSCSADNNSDKVQIKTTPFKVSKNYKKVTDFEQFVQRRIPSVGDDVKKPLLGVHYRYFSDSDKLTSIDNDESTTSDLKEQLARYKCVYRSDWLVDRRQCVLCQGYGDDDDDLCGRLMNVDCDTWVHLNCGLWCFDVFETVSGSLVGVQSAMTKASKTRCSLCQETGAGIQCYRTKCNAVYHVPCAHRAGCIFYTDRGMYCPSHAVLNHPMQLFSLRADRRVIVGRDECAVVTEVVLAETRSPIRLGTLTVHEVGQLRPAQVASGRYHTSSVIYPVGYHSSRIYWSTIVANERCRYDCHIDDSDDGDNDGPVFRVVFGDRTITDRCCDRLWHGLLTKVAQLRHEHGLTRLFPAMLSGEQLYGLTEPHIVRVIESLPAVESLVDYAFKFGRLELINGAMPAAINRSGSARTEPKIDTNTRHRRPSTAAAITTAGTVSGGILKTKWCSSDSPMSLATILSVKTCNSRLQQYKRLRYDWFNNVVLSRSTIQGLGLFAAKDLEKSTMIIEYMGEIIRNEVGNRREQLYQSRNNSIYMFRLSDDLIIDATVRGGLARYINHSCEPNCQAEFLSLDSLLGGRIVISTKQRIESGDELTYDYKFDYEDESGDKIPCLCASENCRGWMN